MLCRRPCFDIADISLLVTVPLLSKSTSLISLFFCLFSHVQSIQWSYARFSVPLLAIFDDVFEMRELVWIVLFVFAYMLAPFCIYCGWCLLVGVSMWIYVIFSNHRAVFVRTDHSDRVCSCYIKSMSSFTPLQSIHTNTTMPIILKQFFIYQVDRIGKLSDVHIRKCCFRVLWMLTPVLPSAVFFGNTRY